MTNVCKNCKHFTDAPLLVPSSVLSVLEFPLCVSPNRKENDLVHGQRHPTRNCGAARMDANDCGAAGNWFVPSLRTRIVTSLFGRTAS